MSIRIPNTLTKKQLKNFVEIYKGIYGITISNDQAEKQGLEIIRFIATILKAKYQK